jgi:hypothetical protein
MLQGNTRLSLYRKGIEVKRVEKKNTITGYVDGVLNEGNYGLLIPQNKLLPVRQFFEGCILTDNVNDATGNMINHNSSITACAGNDAYSGTYLKRGSASQESAVISSPNGYKGYRFVWDWGTDRGNGAIASVCLTRPAIAISEISDSAVPSVAIDERFYTSTSAESDYTFGRLNIIDYNKEVAYRVDYANNTISIAEYQLSCKGLHLLTRPKLFYSGDTYTPEYVTTHQIAQSVDNMTIATASISYTGDTIYIITWSGSNIKAYPISTSTWEVGTIVEKTFNSVTFMNTNGGYVDGFHKDIVLLDGNYAWCMVSISSVVKMVKLNLLGSGIDITEYSLPVTMSTNNNGCCLLLPNGDFYKFSAQNSTTTALYYHNNKFYACIRSYEVGFWGGGFSTMGVNGNIYGTYLNTASAGVSASEIDIGTLHGFVSTIANLDEVVIKNADLTAKLTYEITETNS